MTELDQELPNLALELINEFGKNVAYSIVSSDAYNVATGVSALSYINFNLKAIVEDYNLQGSGQALALGLIETGDKKLTMAAISFNSLPTTEDTFLVDGIKYRVVNVKITYSGELAAIYELQGRQN